jgi:DNA-binding transcriptional LysR family regulator
MELRHLRYFVAAAEHLNFTKAAHALGIAQPPFSVQIRNLESELGTPLFEREARKIRLTPAGHAFLENAKEILKQADFARQRILDESKGRAGLIRIAHTEAAHTAFITKKLRKFIRRHPGVRLVPEPLSKDGFEAPAAPDAAILETAEDGIPLETGRVCFAVPPKHRLADRTEADWADLIGETLLFHPQRTAAERIAEEALAATSLQINRRETSDGSTLWHASLGLGIGLCSSLARGTLDTTLVPVAGTELQTRLVLNPRSRSVALQSLVDFLQA